MTWKVHPLPFAEPAPRWLDRLRDLPRPFLLQSGATSGERYDILGADPGAVVTTTGGVTRVVDADGDVRADDPFDAIQILVDARRPRTPCPIDVPFSGGAAGTFGYEIACQLEPVGAPAPDAFDGAELEVGIYDWCVVRDHAAQKAWLIATPRVPSWQFEQIRNRLAGDAPTPGDFHTTSPVTSSFTREAYDAAIARVLDYIGAGDCYQVNLTQRFEAGFEGDPLALYAAIAARQNAPFGACLLSPNGAVLSFSPERFLRIEGSRVVTQPIKGTRRRGETPSVDQALAEELAASEKDRAENLMIVDLLRNDLGRCCRTGSIRVEQLFELQTFRNVHHLVSTVTGELSDGVRPMELVRSCFPGGSITGAPKIRAMQIIAELEPVRRGPYCGAIGYLGYSGTLDLNLPIRTMVCAGGRVRYWGGGGIVADSTAGAEYDESLAKVDFIRDVLSAAATLPRQSAPATRRTR